MKTADGLELYKEDRVYMIDGSPLISFLVKEITRDLALIVREDDPCHSFHKAIYNLVKSKHAALLLTIHKLQEQNQSLVSEINKLVQEPGLLPYCDTKNCLRPGIKNYQNKLIFCEECFILVNNNV